MKDLRAASNRGISANTADAVAECLSKLSDNEAADVVREIVNLDRVPPNLLGAIRKVHEAKEARNRPRAERVEPANAEPPADPAWAKKYLAISTDISAWHSGDCAKWYTDEKGGRRLDIKPIPGEVAANGDSGDGYYKITHHFCVNRFEYPPTRRMEPTMGFCNRARCLEVHKGECHDRKHNKCKIVETPMYDRYPHDEVYAKADGNLEEELRYMDYYAAALRKVRAARGINDGNRPPNAWDDIKKELAA